MTLVPKDAAGTTTRCWGSVEQRNDAGGAWLKRAGGRVVLWRAISRVLENVEEGGERLRSGVCRRVRGQP